MVEAIQTSLKKVIEKATLTYVAPVVEADAAVHWLRERITD